MGAISKYVLNQNGCIPKATCLSVEFDEWDKLWGVRYELSEPMITSTIGSRGQRAMYKRT